MHHLGAAAQGEVDHVRWIGVAGLVRFIQEARGIEQSVDEFPLTSPAPLVQDLNRQQLHIPHDPRHAQAVVGGCADGAGYVGSVSVVIVEVIVPGHEVVPIAVVQLRCQLWVVFFHPRIHHGDADGGIACHHGPGLGQAD